VPDQHPQAQVGLLVHEAPTLPARRLTRRTPGEALRTRLLSLPAWAWIAAIVAVSALYRVINARHIQAPTVLADELIYSKDARSFAATGHFLLHGAGTSVYGPLSRLYPVLISPAFAVTHSLPSAYELAKAINGLVMSLAAIPAYLIARRVLSPTMSLVAAALSVALPALAYTALLMTESAAYPAFLVCVLAMMSALDNPVWQRQLAVFPAVGLLFATRAQGVILLPAYLTAMFVLGGLEGRPSGMRARLGYAIVRFRCTLAVITGGAAALLLGELAQSRAPLEFLGSYQGLGRHIDATAVPKWFVYHLADLDLYAGVVPCAAFGVLAVLALRGRLSRPLRAFTILSLSVLLWMTLLTAAFSTSVFGGRNLHDRYLFYVVPLVVIGFLAFIEVEGRRYRWLTLVAAAVAAILPLTLPWRLAIGARIDVVALLPWVVSPIDPRHIPVAATALAVLLAGLVAVPRALAPLLIGVVALNFYVLSAATNWQETFSSQILAEVRVHKTWIDDAVGPNQDVAALWFANSTICSTGKPAFHHYLALWENEFFNRALKRTYYVGEPPDAMPANALIVDPRTRGLVTRGGGGFAPRYVTLTQEVRLRAPIVARDPQTRTVLYRYRKGSTVVPPAGCAALSSARASK
jgi:Dolichyl-phosphate-mannose-protein mannosyltransferase